LKPLDREWLCWQRMWRGDAHLRGVEATNMAKKADSFRAFASVMCMSAERLEAFAKRVRRRTASPLYRHIDAMLARRSAGVLD
jgi:hypothetical protein